ncbi:unnamed protein product, partial [Ectocarpus sp. 12 AP-2014]
IPRNSLLSHSQPPAHTSTNSSPLIEQQKHRPLSLAQFLLAFSPSYRRLLRTSTSSREVIHIKRARVKTMAAPPPPNTTTVAAPANIGSALARRAMIERRAQRQAQASQLVLSSRRWVAAAAASSGCPSLQHVHLEEIRRNLIARRRVYQIQQ